MQDGNVHTSAHCYLIWWKDYSPWKQFLTITFLLKATILSMWMEIPISLVKQCTTNISAILDTQRCVVGRVRRATGTWLLMIILLLMLLGAMRHQSLMPKPFVIGLLSIPERVSLSLDGLDESFVWVRPIAPYALCLTCVELCLEWDFLGFIIVFDWSTYSLLFCVNCHWPINDLEWFFVCIVFIWKMTLLKSCVRVQKI